MQDLLKKIEADANARLLLPPGRTADQERARFQAFLRLETHRLKLAHRNGTGGLEICQARAAMLDHVIRHLWEAALITLSPQARKEFPPIAVVALGGYGRSELNPHSDIDLMFLHEGHGGEPDARAAGSGKVMNGVWLPLFDLGPNPPFCAPSPNAPPPTTNAIRAAWRPKLLIEARLIVGDESCSRAFKDRSRVC
jgi:[protein-PII] uridylyltransferase